MCDSVLGVQGNMSGVTIRKYGSNERRPMRFFKAGSTTSRARGVTEPSLTLQKQISPPPRTGLLLVPHLHYACSSLIYPNGARRVAPRRRAPSSNLLE